MRFCDIGTHDYESPNLHNLACFGRSVSEVIRHHQDLAPQSSTTQAHSGADQEVEVIRPHSGVRVIDHRNFHVEGDIRKYLKDNTILRQTVVQNNLTLESQNKSVDVKASSVEYVDSKNATNTRKQLHTDAYTFLNSSDDAGSLQVTWQHDRAKRALPYEDITELDFELPTTEVNRIDLFSNGTLDLSSVELNDPSILNITDDAATNSGLQFNIR